MSKYLVHQTIENRQIEGIQAKDVYFLESELKNCSIKGIQSEYVKFANCVFENVIFDNYYKAGYVYVEQCKFKNCVFHDIFGSCYLNMKYNIFQDCLFDGIRTEIEENGAFICDNRFLNCIFKDVDYDVDELYSNVVIGGKIEHIFYRGGNISKNQFSDIQLDDIKVNLRNYSFDGNELASVIFKNVTLQGQMEENNKFFILLFFSRRIWALARKNPPAFSRSKLSLC